MPFWEKIIPGNINKTTKLSTDILKKIHFYTKKSQLELYFNHATTFFRWNFEEFEEYIANNISWYQTILSLPCSIWPEAYSIAAIMENLHIPYHIDGVDFSQKCIEKAKMGFYNIETDKVTIDLNYLDKYEHFFSVKNQKIYVNPKLKEKIVFFTWDILTKAWLPEKKYDIIVFQNLIIHFQDDPWKIKIMVKNLKSLLKKWGIIFTDDVEINSIIRNLDWKYEKIGKSLIKIYS